MLIVTVASSTLNDRIYTPINFGKLFCFRMTNFNTQVGCQTSRDGDTGILYPFYSENSIAETFSSLNEPIIPIIGTPLFTNRTANLFSKHSLMRGLIIIEENYTTMEPFSPEKTCPGDGFNVGETAKLGDAPKTCGNNNNWNPTGNWLSYYSFPFGIFVIKSDSQKELITEPANQNLIKSSLKPYPLWGAQIQAFMNAAGDSETCVRRGTCDPVGGLNLHINFIPKNLLSNRPIILLVTKADATAFFKHMSFGGEASGGSLAVLLGVVKALSQVRDNDPANDFTSELSAEIMVTFLQAESFDYSGSQRMAYDLKQNQFGNGPYNISLSDVKGIIEIGPISLSNELYLHSHNHLDKTVEQIQNLFAQYSGIGKKFKFINVNKLPPSSLNSFIREDETVPGVLITDSNTELLSSLYGSRFDILDNSNILSSQLKALIEVIANVALQFAGGTESTNVKVEKSLVNDVLDCFLVNQNCSLLQQLLNKTGLDNERLSRFSSVGHQSSNFTTYLTYLTRDFSKKELDIPKISCNSTSTGSWVPYIKDDKCYGVMINHTSAKSPAFILGQYKSTNYSTWTESRWSNNFKLRVFLVASNNENIALFCCGLLYFVVLSVFILQCHRRSDQVYLRTGS